jgi:hypothetical protein
MLDVQLAWRALSRAFDSAGNSIAADYRSGVGLVVNGYGNHKQCPSEMAMTTSSSINCKRFPFLHVNFPFHLIILRLEIT